MSTNIQVVSIVGRFLEHSRIYYFENGGEPEAWIGSADMMRRNLDRRIEVLVSLKERAHVDYLRDLVLIPHFVDNCKAWRLLPDGEYDRVTGEPSFNLQESLIHHPASLKSE